MKFLLVICLCAVSNSFGAIRYGPNNSDSLVFVQTPKGRIAGTINQTVYGQNVYYKFSGIPYAKAPVGDLRFKPPQPADPWQGTLFAVEEGSKCLQMSDLDIIGSEDCLFLNVYTRSIKPAEPYAVMVWVHGGGFNTLSGNYETFGPDYFLDDNVVIVTLNYRLGVLGWLSTEDEVAPGNYALKDILLALQWVKENIKYFGGDPDKVTLFGNSAGSAAVSYLVQSRKSKGLIHRAIMESGTSLCLFGLRRNPKEVARRLADLLGIPSTNSSAELVESLKSINASQIVVAQQILKPLVEVENALAGVAYAPVIEPDHPLAVVTEKSHVALSRGQFNKIPVIIGFNSNEMGAFFSTAVWKAILLSMSLFPENWAPISLTNDTIKRKQAASLIQSRYFDPDVLIVDQIDNAINFSSIDQFIRPIRETVNLMSKYVDVFYYKFSYVGNAAQPVETRTYWGTCHGEEQYYLWLAPYPDMGHDLDMRLSLVNYWTDFAKMGSTFANIHQWPNARSKNNRTDQSLYLLNIDYQNEVQKNPNQSDWQFYKSIFKKYGDGDYDTY